MMVSEKINSKPGLLLKPVLENCAGSVAVEAAIAFPVLLLFIFSFIALVQLLSVRSLVYDEIAQETRRRAVSDLPCGGGGVVTTAATETKNRILDGLQVRGIQIDPSKIQVTADQPLPEDVTSWNVSAQFDSQCPVCQMFPGMVPFRGFFSVNMSIYRDAKGCF